MRVEVRLFANFRETAGTGRLELEVDGDRVRDVLEALFREHPGIAEYAAPDGELRGSVRVLLNGDVTIAEAEVSPGDEVALLPPVSGGMRLGFKAWLENDEGESVLGEGGSDILAAVDREGSVSGAAERLGMSNRYALERILKMEERAGTDLVERTRGGKGGGGSSLTDAGRRLLDVYERAEEEMRRTCGELGEEL